MSFTPSSLACSLVFALFHSYLVNNVGETLHVYLLVLLGDKHLTEDSLFLLPLQSVYPIPKMFPELCILECCIGVSIGTELYNLSCSFLFKLITICVTEYYLRHNLKEEQALM